jgi:NIMA (never in mitosis gene a)-related kinase
MVSFIIYKGRIGSFGKVCKIKRKSDGKVMVWKELNYGKMGEKEK